MKTGCALEGAEPREDRMLEIRWAIEIPHLALIAAMWAAAIIVWPTLPDLLPVHWTGLPPAIPMHPDDYGGKVQALLLFPMLASGLYAVLLVMPIFAETNPGGRTLDFAVVRVMSTALLACIFFANVLLYKGYRVDLAAVYRDTTLWFLVIFSGWHIWRLIQPHL